MTPSARDRAKPGGRRGPNTWRIAFAVGLLLRPLLIAPMAPSGPLGGSDALPLALGLLVVGHVAWAALAVVGNRPAIALGIVTGVVGVPLAALGTLLALPAPWPLVLTAWNGALAAVGVVAWRSMARQLTAAERPS
ncbi:MAG TPA: hypothetical protein VJ506_11340 [Candidatus Limnocylindrales bacterium]|nr:hypothetical protein [Candidatus Limnocylindrales bacterium]